MAASPRISAGDWEYETVFRALISQGQKHTHLQSGDSYVHLYPQPFNCAILYCPASYFAKHGPLHLKPTQVKSWEEEKFLWIKPFIKHVKLDPNNFDLYHVKDWNGFAAALKLELS